MLTINKNCFLGLMLLGLSLGISSALYSADKATSQPYYLTLSEAYGRPFATADFSGKKSYGVSTTLSFEYRHCDMLSLGASYEYLSLLMDPTVLSMNGLDIFGRVMPFGKAIWEPYGLLGAGVAMTSNNITEVNATNYHAFAGLGVLYSLTEALTFDLGVRYQSSSHFNYVDCLLGLQWRFGIPLTASAPTTSGDLIKK